MIIEADIGNRHEKGLTYPILAERKIQMQKLRIERLNRQSKMRTSTEGYEETHTTTRQEEDVEPYSESKKCKPKRSRPIIFYLTSCPA